MASNVKAVRIYIDTNVFVDLYRGITDHLKVLDEIVARGNLLVMPEQTVSEFYRNRAAILSEVKKQFDESTQKEPYTSNLTKSLPEFADLLNASKQLRKKAKELSTKIQGMTEDEDPIAVKFGALLSAREVLHLKTTEEILKLAHKRKLLGNPPTTQNKHSIGDEVIWECLLANCPEDLIIVTRDHGFLDYESVLKKEFEITGVRELKSVERTISEALKKAGAPSEVISESDKRNKASISEWPQCKACGVPLEETGFEGNDGDEAWWMYCPKCGAEFFPPDI